MEVGPPNIKTFPANRLLPVVAIFFQSSVKKPTLNAAVAFKCQCSEFCMFTRKGFGDG